MRFLSDVVDCVEEEPLAQGENGDHIESTSQADNTKRSSRKRKTKAQSNEIASEQVWDQFLELHYDDGTNPMDRLAVNNAPATVPTVPVNTLLKLEQLDHKLDTLIKTNKISEEPNYSFAISLLEMLRCIKDDNELAVLKAKIYKLIADSIAAQR